MGSSVSSNTRMEEIKNETPDLEQIPIDEVFKRLNCSRNGLTTADGKERLQIFGPNKLEERKEMNILTFFGLSPWYSSSRAMQIAALMAVVVINWIGHSWDVDDISAVWVLAVVILSWVMTNSLIKPVMDTMALQRVASLTAGTASLTKVLRDGVWREQNAAILVPGDIISIKRGDIVTADARLLEGDYQLTIDQCSAIDTAGASPLPVTTTKKPGEVVFSGSTCKQGEAEAVVIATGLGTLSGKAVVVIGGNYAGAGSTTSQDVLRSVGNFCMCCVVISIAVEIMVMHLIQKRKYKYGIGNFMVLLIGVIPVAVPVVVSMCMLFGMHRLSQLGAIPKRMTAIEKMAGMDVLCCDKTGTLTLNKPVIERDLIEVFAKDVDKEHAILLAARASRTDNLLDHPIDAAIIGMLADPKEARAGIKEVHFQPFNPVDRRTALTYIDCDGNWHRVTKGDPEQILNLCCCKEDIRQKVHSVIDKFAERGLWSLGVACQILEKNKDTPGGPWQFVALLSLFDPPMLDSVEAIRMARKLGVDVKMMTTGYHLAFAKETGRRLGIGEDIYPCLILFGQDNDDAPGAAFPVVDELIEKAEGFAGVLPDTHTEHKCAIVSTLQKRNHICGVTGSDGVIDALALKKADVGIAVAGASDAAISASDIVLTKPGLSVIVSAVLTSRAFFFKMKSYMIYAVSTAIFTLLGSMLVTLIWGIDLPVRALFALFVFGHDCMMLAIPTDRVRPSPHPESWNTKEVLANGIGLGSYLALTTVLFFWAMRDTDFFTDIFYVRSLRNMDDGIRAALYLEAAILAQALIFVTRSRSWCFVERPGLLLIAVFIFNQLITTVFVAVYLPPGLGLEAIGWGWAGVIWLYSVVVFFPLDWIKFAIRYILSGSTTWDNLLENKTAWTGEDYKVVPPRKSPWTQATSTFLSQSKEPSPARPVQ